MGHENNLSSLYKKQHIWLLVHNFTFLKNVNNEIVF